MPKFRVIVIDQPAPRRLAKVFEAATMDEAHDLAFDDDWREWEEIDRGEGSIGIADDLTTEVL